MTRSRRCRTSDRSSRAAPDQLRPRRRPTVSVDVGGVLVGVGPPDRRPVDDQHRHGRCRRARPSRSPGWPTPAASSSGSRSTTKPAAAAVPEIIRKVRGLGVDVPIIGDFHYNGHLLLERYPEAAAALAKYRINPGNVGAKRHDEHFQTIVRIAIDNDKPVRIGVNWGSLDQALLTELMEANARLAAAARLARRDDRRDDRSRRCARPSWPRRPACGHDRIILSAKVSGVRDLVDVYRRLAPLSDYPLHLGPDRGGHGDEGDRRLDGRPGDPAQRGNRRHDPGLADARAGRRPRARGRGRPAGPPVARACAASCPRSAPARAAAGRPRPSSR